MDFLRRQGKYSTRPKVDPAVVLLDIKMPRMDGIEVLSAIRSDDNLKSIPVVMLTSSREEPDLKKCYALGVNAYVVKPVDFKDMCLAHGMEPLPLSSLFEWGAPFQMSAYCASAMDLEQNWVKFLQ